MKQLSAQLLCGLKHMANRGVVHLDQKHENLLVSENLWAVAQHYQFLRHLARLEDGGSALASVTGVEGGSPSESDLWREAVRLANRSQDSEQTTLPKGALLIADFGISRFLEQDGMIREQEDGLGRSNWRGPGLLGPGTMKWISPEFWKMEETGREWNDTVDVWGAGTYSKDFAVGRACT